MRRDVRLREFLLEAAEAVLCIVRDQGQRARTLRVSRVARLMVLSV
jgi:hypothetical protein